MREKSTEQNFLGGPKIVHKCYKNSKNALVRRKQQLRTE